LIDALQGSNQLMPEALGAPVSRSTAKRQFNAATASFIRGLA
jgi:hypothetical protein